MEGGSIVRPKRIVLVISSNSEELSERKYMLYIRGYAVWIASTGEAAIKYFVDREIDLVLCDWNLSDGTGPACIQTLKKIANHVPMILLGKSYRDVLETTPADAVLLKSISAAELVDRIRIMSARKRGPRKGTPRSPRRAEIVPAIRAAVAGLVLFAVVSIACGAQRATQRAYYEHHGSAVLQDSKVTPGAVDPQLTKAKLCDPAFHTGTVRNVTHAMKVQACEAYGQNKAWCPGKRYEIDHLISIELGGANDPSNLWPEPVDAPGVIGYHSKDVVENRAHRAVCSGQITLKQAQDGISTDWYKFGLANGFIAK
jgi:DNA-binding response OmpR family regulator